MKLILLAAGKSSRIFNNINKNKCLIKLNNKTLIEKIIENAISHKIKEIEIVVGFKKNYIKKTLKKYKNLKYIENKKYDSTDMVYSAMLALKRSNTDLIISYTDILFDKILFRQINNMDKRNITIPFTKKWKKIWNLRKKNILDDAETFFKDKKTNLTEIGKKITKKNINKVQGQFLGIIFIPKKKIKSVQAFYQSRKNKKIQFTQFINEMIKKKFIVKCINYKNFWYEVDDIDDLKNFQNLKN